MVRASRARAPPRGQGRADSPLLPPPRRGPGPDARLRPRPAACHRAAGRRTSGAGTAVTPARRWVALATTTGCTRPRCGAPRRQRAGSPRAIPTATAARRSAGAASPRRAKRLRPSLATSRRRSRRCCRRSPADRSEAPRSRPLPRRVIAMQRRGAPCSSLRQTGADIRCSRAVRCAAHGAGRSADRHAAPAGKTRRVASRQRGFRPELAAWPRRSRRASRVSRTCCRRSRRRRSRSPGAPRRR